MPFFFKVFTALHVFIYRLTNGSIMSRMNGGDVLLLNTVGRKSGKKRTNPLVYLQDGEDYLIVASAGGSDKHPGWYWNAVKGDGAVTIQVKDKVMPVHTSEVEGDAYEQLYQRFVDEVGAFFADYQAKTERMLPVVRLSPQ